MDFLNKAFEQISELFRSMTPAGRITTGLLFAVLATSFVFLFRIQGDKADEYLFGAEPLTSSEVTALVAAFSKAGLTDWDDSGNRIRVPRAKRSLYLAAAAEEDALPESFGSIWDNMLQSSSWGDTRDIREIRTRVAKEKQLANVLRQLPAVESAAVSIEDGIEEGFPPRKQRRALAAVKATGNKLLNDEQVKTIRYTVASGVAIDATDVTVTDLNGPVTYPGLGKNATPHEFENLYATYTKQFVDFYRDNISSMLTPMYPGVQVTVNVELEKDLQNRTSSYKYDDKANPVQQTTFTRELSAASGTPGGRPGAATNGVSSNTAAQISSTESSQSTTNETRDEIKNVLGATQTQTTKAGLTPVWISASISVPTSTFVRTWMSKNPSPPGEAPRTPTPEELDKIKTETIKDIEESVANLLPRPPIGEDLYKRVKVVTFADQPPTAPVEPALAETAIGWLAENWQTLGMFGLALFGVVFLRGMIRSAQSSPPESFAARESIATPLDTSDKDTESDGEESGSETVANALRRKFQSSGRTLRDELTELVREDPDAAANILKVWINDAA